MKLRFSSYLIAGIALIMMIAGCASGSNTPNPPAAISVSLSPQAPLSIDADSTTNLTAVAASGADTKFSAQSTATKFELE